MPQHNSPDRNAADEQRQAHQRSCFLKDCAQDGLRTMPWTQPQYLGVPIRTVDVLPADTAATAAATRQAMEVERFRQWRNPTITVPPSLQPVKEP